MKADAQIPEGPVLVGTPVFSDLHSLSIANVILSSVYFLSLPVYLSLYLIALHFLPTFDKYSLRLVMYAFLPHMPHEGPSCLGNIIRPSSGLSHPLLSCSLSVRCSFVMCSTLHVGKTEMLNTAPGLCPQGSHNLVVATRQKHSESHRKVPVRGQMDLEHNLEG